MESTGIDGEADQGADTMPALKTGGTGVDVEEMQLLVVLHLEDMAVATDEEGGRIGEELTGDAAVVASGIASDVGHQDRGSLAGPTEFLREHEAQVATIAVADHSTQRTEGGEAVGNFGAADVAGVPDFVALGEVLQVLVVPIGVGVAQEADSFHDSLSSCWKREKRGM